MAREGPSNFPGCPEILSNFPGCPEILLILLLILVIVLACLIGYSAGKELIRAHRLRSPGCATACAERTGGGEGGRQNSKKGFPYLTKILPPEQEMFETLAESKPVVVGRKGYEAVVQRAWPADMLACDAISSHFTEKVRAECRFGHRPSPLQLWSKASSHAQIIAKANELMREHEEVPRILALREGILSVGSWCNYYNPAFCLWLYKQFARKLDLPRDKVRILDPSAGWGDRLIAACAFGPECYHAFDPNTELTEAYRAIIEQFGRSGADNRYRVVAAPFETAAEKHDLHKSPELGAGKGYHIVHTSPPFFNLEDYPAEGGKVGKENRTYASWRNKFYRPYLQTAWNALAPGGYLCLYLDDLGSKMPLASDADKLVKEWGGAKEGVYGFQQVADYPEADIKEEGKTRGAHFWRKPGKSCQRADAARKSGNLVVDTLNLAHYLIDSGKISGPLSTEAITRAIDASAPVFKESHPGRVIYVLKDRSSQPADDAFEAYMSAARRNQVSVHLAESYRPAGPVSDEFGPGRNFNSWRRTGKDYETHQQKGRDDFYMGLIAWQLKCPVVTNDKMRDFQELKQEVPPFVVRIYNHWETHPTTNQINPNAPSYAKVRAPVRIKTYEFNI